MHGHALLPLALWLFGCAVASDEPATRDAPEAEGVVDARGTPTGPAPAVDAAPASPGLTCDDSTCIDPTTGLTWQSPPDDTARTWADAVAYCEALTVAGGGWRLPRVQELRSLIRGCPNTALGGACRATDPTCTVRACMEGCDQCATTIVNDEPVCLWAPGLRGSCRQAHWSATKYTDSIDPGAWYVDFGHGVRPRLAAQPAAPRAVRALSR